jgi:NAD+ diphosphatase
MPFESMITPPDHMIGRAGLWFCVVGNNVLVHVEGGVRVPQVRHPEELGIRVDHEHFLGVMDDMPVWAAGIDSSTPEIEGMAAQMLFALFPNMDETTWVLAGRAVQIAEWHRTHRYCGRCGERTVEAPGERATKCPACGLLCFPRIAPAVITLVEKDGEALLARGRTFGANPMYSVLAGFVEPGETLEECVAREVKEEVGVDVTDIRYHSSQPWPFPHSLMVGFTAKYAGGEISLQESEILDAQWWRPDALPNIPGKISIARRLIDWWLAKEGYPV